MDNLDNVAMTVKTGPTGKTAWMEAMGEEEEMVEILVGFPSLE